MLQNIIKRFKKRYYYYVYVYHDIMSELAEMTRNKYVGLLGITEPYQYAYWHKIMIKHQLKSKKYESL